MVGCGGGGSGLEVVSGGGVTGGGVVGGFGLGGACVVSGGALVGGSGAGTRGSVGACWRFWSGRRGWPRAKGDMGAASTVRRMARVASRSMEGPFILRLDLLGY